MSDRAKRFAKALGIEVFEKKKLEKFPSIKCNINKQTKEKIYHLPFDQLYDQVIIEENKGEFYAKSVEEAENMGFRRAKKWVSEKV